MSELNRIINLLELQPHPEGGFYREMYRSKKRIRDFDTSADKCAYTTIYYLLGGQDFSSWHRIQSDETWFYHSGCDLLVYYFDEARALQTTQVGLASMNLQATIPANTWFAAKPIQEDSFSLVSCAVAPGFEFGEFELGAEADLLKVFGNNEKSKIAIQALTRL